MLIIGNAIALAASILMVYSGILKNKKKILYVQSIQIGLFTISNLVLNGIPGVIINAINFIRNILCYKNKLGLIEKIVLTVLTIILVIYFNNLGVIGLLPLIGAIVYLWFMTVQDVKKFKLLIIITTVLWCVYDFTIQSYTSSVFDLLTILTNVISIIKNKEFRKN